MSRCGGASGREAIAAGQMTAVLDKVRQARWSARAESTPALNVGGAVVNKWVHLNVGAVFAVGDDLSDSLGRYVREQNRGLQGVAFKEACWRACPGEIT